MNSTAFYKNIDDLICNESKTTNIPLENIIREYLYEYLQDKLDEIESKKILKEMKNKEVKTYSISELKKVYS